MTMQKITNAENGINNFFTAVFTHEPVMYDVAVMKIWDDLNNADDIRPESVTIRLMLNGKPQDQSLTLSAWNAWTDSFTILADTEGYHIEEDKVKGYSASISGDVRNGFIVTNKHVPAVRNTSDLPQTGDHSRMALWMTLCAASLGALAMLCMKKRRTE